MKSTFFLLLIPGAVYATCPDISGRYQVDKDVEYGDSYTLEYSQTGCTTLTETTSGPISQTTGSTTVTTDGKMKTYSYSGGRAMSVFYRFTRVGFHTVQTRMKNTDEFDDSTEILITKNVDGSLNLERRDTDNNGVLKVRVNRARKLP